MRAKAKSTKKPASKRQRVSSTGVRKGAQPTSIRATRTTKRAKPEAAETKPQVVKSPLSKKELAHFKERLQALRDRVIDEIGFLTGDNLNRSQRDSSGDLSGYSVHMADQGTDNFDREFALNLASSEQDTLYEIDEALARIEMNTYGVCEMCGCPIEKARLEALPYARMCIKCKTQSEKGKTYYRPFGPTLSQTMPSE